MSEKIFISHTTKDDPFVKELRRVLENQGLDTWADSREMRGGDKLKPEVKKAIETAPAFIVVFSKETPNSGWVYDEIQYALKTQKKRSGDYRIIPLLLEGMKPAALRPYFGKKEVLAVRVGSGPGALNEALPEILAALGKRLPDDVQPMRRPPETPLEELRLELQDLSFQEVDGVRRAIARATLTYIPAAAARQPVESKRYKFTAPLGPIEMEDLRWYLEQYHAWPSGVFKQRAEKIELKLPEWGQQLYEMVTKSKAAETVLKEWHGVDSDAARLFTVTVDQDLMEGSSEAEQNEAREAGNVLFSLPWELLNDGESYLFRGAEPVLVRRQLPNRRGKAILKTKPPIRILVVSPRPEDDFTGYFDHRASALPLVNAIEQLGELAELTILAPATFTALRKALETAKKNKQPYHVVHFDGHGVYNPQTGLGGLCFEDPRDANKLDRRRSKVVDAQKLAEVIKKHRIPLFFLDACQTAKIEDESVASVAAELLNHGVASVVAMSHSVLIPTATLFVTEFYTTLVTGARVGEAMLAGQQELYEKTYRMKIFGAGDLHLQDWFLPVLYQEIGDPQLFTRRPSERIQSIDQKALQKRLGELPPAEYKFVGRSRPLLALERLLAQKPYAVIVGQGGEGKTALGAELARWLVRSRRFRRAVFVSVENIFDLRTVVDSIGQQLLNNYSVAQYDEADLFDKALLPIERALENEPTLIVFDNMESILPPAAAKESQAAPAVANLEAAALQTFWQLCQTLQKTGATRLLFTSREKLPQPFNFNHIPLSRLPQDEAIKLVQQVMTAGGLTPLESDDGATQPEIEALVNAVNCHARSLVLLAPQVSRFGVLHTTAHLGKLMAELHQQYPEERERSLFASVELSLRRLPKDLREKIRPLGVFQGGAHIAVLQVVLELTEEERDVLVTNLLETALAEQLPYNYLRLHPALCPYLYQELEESARQQAAARWAENTGQLANYLYRQGSRDARLAAALTLLELPNLLKLLEYRQAQDNPEATVDFATTLEGLLQFSGRQQLLKAVAKVREAQARRLGDWSHTAFEAAGNRIERLMESGNLQQAFQEAQGLLEKSLQAGEQAYREAEYDIALTYILLGRIMSWGGAAEPALQPLGEAQRRLQLLAEQGDTAAAGMAAKSLTEKGDCLRALGRLEEAAAAYEEGIKGSEELKDARGVAIGKGQLATVRLYQKRYDDALTAYHDARKIFEELGEPGSVAAIWHQVGRVHEDAGQFAAAEQAYRKSLAIKVQQKNAAGEASTLTQLGLLYDEMGRLEEAVVFLQKALDIDIQLGDKANEGKDHNNLAIRLIKLQRYEEARQEIRRAIECKEPYGHAATPWNAYHILHNLEQAAGNPEAAARAREKALELFLAYRRAGGENHEGSGRLAAWFSQALQEQQPADAIEKQLAELVNQDPRWKPFVSALQAILSGSRDPALADDPNLDYDDAAEILLLLEGLE